jgi:hypothetical protein
MKKPTLPQIVPLGLLLAAYAVLHFWAGFNLPTPWRDEAHFLWQANGFAEHFSFFSPELNESRTIFWMPPGYFVVMGIVIKLFGLSLTVARTVSLLFSLATVYLMVAIARRYASPLVAALIAAPFVLGIPFVATGNIARMEPLLLFALLGSFLFLLRGQFLYGLCLLAITPLIHPNGAPFLITGIIAIPFMVNRPIQWRRPTGGELAALAAVVILYAAYAFYLSAHWADFSTDMAYQLQRKADRDIKSSILTYGSVILAIFTLAGTAYAIRRKIKAIFLLAIALPAWWVAAAGIEMWYRIFFALSFFCYAVFLFAVVLDIQSRIEIRWKRKLTIIGLSLVSLTVLAWNIKQGPQSEPLIFPDFRPWNDMTYSSQSYITPGEQTELTNRLRTATASGAPARVEFYPDADAFYFTALRPSALQVTCPLFSSQQADYILVHFAPDIPQAINKLTIAKMQELKLTPDDLARFTLYRRDSATAWFLIPIHH